MVTLPKERYSEVDNLIVHEELRFPLIDAVINGNQPGKILINNNIDIQCAFIYNNFGFCQFIGDRLNKEFNKQLEEVIFLPSEFPVKYLLWYNPSKMWLEITKKSILKSSFKYRKRTRFSSIYNQLSIPENGKINEEYRFVIDKKFIAEAKGFDLNIDKRFWENAEAFIKNGIGVEYYINGEIAAICYSAAIANSVAEIDVATIPKFRGKGYASLVVLKFKELCNISGIDPSWDCFNENAASYKLALKTGFKPMKEYNLLSIYRGFK